MIGQVFFCNGCHRFQAIQDAQMVTLVMSYWTGPAVQAAPGASKVPLTNGASALTTEMLLCTACTPLGAKTTPMREIGVMGVGSRESTQAVSEYLQKAAASEEPPRG